MINDEELIEINKKKARYYFEKGIKVHISLCTDRWLNGKIKEFFSEGFIFDEQLDGEQPVFYQEILPNGISEYKPDEKKDLNIKGDNE